MRIPIATYRLQLHKDFGFAQVAEIVDYLHALGISDIYASPIFKARPGSMHGYDVVDPNQINPELGSSEVFTALSEELRRQNMGWVQDIVPNHMAYDSENRMLMDVLENGPNSIFAPFFDIEWDHPVESMRGKVLAPCLGKFYGACLEDGELVLQYGAEGLSVQYYQQRFPMNIESYGQVLAPSVTQFRRKLGRQHPDLIKLLGVLYSLKTLPSHEEARECHRGWLASRSELPGEKIVAVRLHDEAGRRTREQPEVSPRKTGDKIGVHGPVWIQAGQTIQRTSAKAFEIAGD